MVSPVQQASWSAVAKRCTSPISATKIAAITGPTPLIVSNARYSGLSLSRRAVSTSSPAISVDSVAMIRRCEATRERIRLGQHQGVEHLRPDRAEDVRDLRDHPALAQHRVDARLHRGPVAAPACAGNGPAPAAPGSPVVRSTPSPTGPGAAGPPARVASSASVFARRFCIDATPRGCAKRHLEPGLGQRVDRPVPAIGRLDRDRRTRPGLRDLLDQRRDRVLDPDTLDDLALTIHPHDHTATTMQIDPHVLTRLLVTLVHGGLLLTVGFTDNPRILGSPTEREARPAPSSHHIACAQWRTIARASA